MTLTLLNEWVELQDIDCPPHLRPKRIIDRLGRRTSRCITPAEQTEEISIRDTGNITLDAELPYDVRSRLPRTARGFYVSDEMKEHWERPKFDLSSEDDVIDRFFDILGGEDTEWGKESQYDGSRLGTDPSFTDTLISRREEFKAVSTSVSRLGIEKLIKPVEELEATTGGDYEITIRGTTLKGSRVPVAKMLYNLIGSTYGTHPVNLLQETVSYLFSGKTTRFQKDMNQAKSSGNLSGAGVYSGTKFQSKEIKYHSTYVQAHIEKERELWKSLIGDKSFKVYRGVRINLDDEVPELGANVVQDFPLASWSISPKVASNFGNAILTKTITADDIVASFFGLAAGTHRIESPWDESGDEVGDADISVTILREGEIVLFSPEEGTDVEVVQRYEMNLPPDLQ